MGYTSDRIKALTRSEIRIMSVECEKAGGINLSQGVCDLPLPPVLAQEAKAGIDNGQNHYTRFDGTEELRRAIAGKLAHYNQITVNPETGVVVTAGATGAFYSACLALLNPGDEVILFEPFYGYHEYTLLALGVVPLYARLSPPGWYFDPEAVEHLITPRTRGILVNTPANPSGKVFTLYELRQLSDICTRHNLLMFTDEIYEYIVYDGRVHLSPAAVDGMESRTVIVSGYSKTFSITGWRIGYCACSEELAAPIGCASDLVYVCAPSPLQEGVSKAILALPDSYYENLRAGYERRRNLVCKALAEVGLTPCTPQGAYYVLADVSRIPGQNSKEKAMAILQRTGVATVPGEAFYHNGGGDNLVRLCYAKSDDILYEACERLQKLR
ncbi:pyridoxal phosphate-dependent aminotransferase [Acetanaerobacterium elongatum]|uniref:Aminotransferase n=1 Tax=Acetanaerobacterium elongatum TaxID=258515 RepID=A0A1H0D9N5_9FIRM|nr:pyridoxal phosphate-dependent aminotransferase [Acetanaerobacterium elongatum]SDN66818.1 aminotransferase [Acetanaerobacterium elongatum]